MENASYARVRLESAPYSSKPGIGKFHGVGDLAITVGQPWSEIETFSLLARREASSARKNLMGASGTYAMYPCLWKREGQTTIDHTLLPRSGLWPSISRVRNSEG